MQYTESKMPDSLQVSFNPAVQQVCICIFIANFWTCLVLLNSTNQVIYCKWVYNYNKTQKMSNYQSTDAS